MGNRAQLDLTKIDIKIIIRQERASSERHGDAPEKPAEVPRTILELSLKTVLP